MMDGITSSIAWCTLQVSLVAFVGIVVSLVIPRRHVGVACSIVCMATVVSAVLTFVAPLPVHRWLTYEALPVSALMEVTPEVRSRGQGTKSTSDGSHPVSAPHLMFDLRQLTLSLRSAALQVERFEERRRLSIQVATGLLAVVVLIGLIRLAIGIAFVRRMRRSGVLINDPKLARLLHELAASVNCRAVPEVRESPEFTDAAVAGWCRPVLILPREWRHWSDDELRAVIAHELAHIVRHDTLWRALASSVLAIHSYNPMMHWLSWRIMLYQELAADALAARVVGPQSYLRSLSKLAIRRDDQLGRSVSPDLLPVFSGHLMRRIKVLHSMDGRSEQGSRRGRNLTSVMIAVVSVALGLAVVATRGIAQPPEQQPKPAAGKVTRVSFTKVIAENKSVTDPTREMFQLTPLDPTVFSANNHFGMVALRPRELLRRKDLQSYSPLLNGLLSTWLASELKSKSPPVVSTESVEWIASVPHASFTAKGQDEHSRAQFGVGGLVIKLSQPVNLRQWIERFAPDAKRHQVEGTDVFEITAASLGPVPLCIWTADETTIRIWTKEIKPDTKLAELNVPPILKLAKDSKNSPAESLTTNETAHWISTWKRVDNGLASIVLAKADLSGLLSDLDNRPDAQGEQIKAIGLAYKALISRCTITAVSVDIPENSSQIGARISLIHASPEAAAQSAQDLRQILTLTKGEFAKYINTLNEKEAPAAAEDAVDVELIHLYDAALQAATISVDEYDDKSAAVVISTAIPFDKVVDAVTLSMTGPSAK